MYSSSIEAARKLPGAKFLIIHDYTNFPYKLMRELGKEGIYVYSSSERDWTYKASGLIVQHILVVDTNLTTYEEGFLLSRLRDIGELKANGIIQYLKRPW